jgi:hypothetical protein
VASDPSWSAWHSTYSPDMLAVKGRQDDQERVLNELGQRLEEIAEILVHKIPPSCCRRGGGPRCAAAEAHKAWEILVNGSMRS